MNKEDQKDNERRRFFRIDDEIGLEYYLVSEDEYSNAPELLSQLKQSAFSLSAEFFTLNNEHNTTLNSIRNTHPEIAEYLEIINKKIDSISTHFLEDEIDDLDENIHTVNLSASGIAFKCNEKINDAQAVKLRLILLPEKIGITVYGRAQDNLRSEEQKKEGVICIDFEHILYDDQELMIKHNLNKQMLLLRQRNEDEDEHDGEE